MIKFNHKFINFRIKRAGVLYNLIFHLWERLNTIGILSSKSMGCTTFETYALYYIYIYIRINHPFNNIAFFILFYFIIKIKKNIYKTLFDRKSRYYRFLLIVII